MFEKVLPWGRLERLSWLEWIQPQVWAFMYCTEQAYIKVSHGSTGFVREDTFPEHLFRRY